jgi:hypothetical protein
MSRLSCTIMAAATYQAPTKQCQGHGRRCLLKRIPGVRQREPRSGMKQDRNAHSEDHSAGHEHETAGARQRGCRVWPRRAGVLAVTVGIVMLAAACSSSPSSSSSTGGSSQLQQELSFTTCMRSHGLPTFPDPNPTGVSFGNQQQQQQQRSNPHFPTALSACQHLLPSGGSPQTKQTPNNAQLLRFAQCMRSHGVRNYPDPNPDVSVSSQLAQAGINPNSPGFQNTLNTCNRLAPVQGGGS